MNDTLTSALEHPANDLPDIFIDLYPEAWITKGRTKAAWCSGDSDNIVIGGHTLRDFVSGESYNV